MKILCAVDLPGHGGAAPRLAAQMARRFGDSVQLLHVLAPSAGSEDLSADAAFLASRQEVAAASLAKLGAELTAETGVAVEIAVLMGDPALVIAENARALEARLVVVGLDNRRALAQWFLGSVAERVLRLADRPVIVAPTPEEGAASLAGSWRRRTPLRLLVGLDRSSGSEAALRFVRQLRALGDCDVTFLHVYWPPEEIQRLGLTGRRELMVPDPEIVAPLEHALRLRVGALPGAGEVSFSVRPGWGPTADNILVGAELGRFDLIVVGAEHRRGLSRLWHGSVTEALVRASKVTPVVCVPGLASDGAAHLPQVTRVLVPTDLSAAGNAAIPHAYGLLRDGGIVELCHVIEAHRAHPTYAYDDPPPAITPQRRAEIEAQLRALIPAEAAGLGITTRLSVIEGEGAAEAILQAAARFESDALALASHGRSGLARALVGSVAEEVLRRADRPVLIVRPETARAS
jgi:nucleotide-binding universal stress UspA family protein